MLEEKKLLIECDVALKRVDFLDPLSKDDKQSWSLQTDKSGTQVTLRSLLCPGYVGYQRSNSTFFGGYGLRDKVK